MSNQPDLRIVSLDPSDNSADELRLFERVEDYLDHVCAPLVDLVPYRARQAFREEIRQHITFLVEEHRQAASLEEAIESALQEFGEPWMVGEALAEEWSRKGPLRPGRRIGAASLHAFSLFGLATAINLAVIEVSLLEHCEEACYPYMLFLAALSPILAGCLTGLKAYGQTLRSVIYVSLFLFLDTLVTGFLMLPDLEGIHFALFQALFWLPMGCASAALTATLVRSHRRAGFLRAVRRTG